MNVNPLRRLRSPDLADHVIHFTGRAGPRINVDPEIEALDDESRLLRILQTGELLGFETFGAASSVVCLTESTKTAISFLVREGRYTPCGVGFSKQYVFDRGGGPALYVRGDEWSMVQSLPEPLRSRAVRFWPGAAPAPGEFLASDLTAPSEWLHEREWRVPERLVFDWDDVEFLLVPSVGWGQDRAGVIAESIGDEWAAWFAAIPSVVLAADGCVVEDASGIWA